MAVVVTYRNDAECCFCQLKLESGERVFVQFALHEGKPTILIQRMDSAGRQPTEILWQMEWSLENMEAFFETFGEPPQLPPPARGFLDAVSSYVGLHATIGELKLGLGNDAQRGTPTREVLSGYAEIIRGYLEVIQALPALFPHHESRLFENKEVIRQAMLKYFELPALQLAIGLDVPVTAGHAIEELLLRRARDVHQSDATVPRVHSLPLEEQAGVSMALAYCLLAYFISSVEDARASAKTYAAVYGGSAQSATDADIDRDIAVCRAVEQERQRLSDELKLLG